MRRFVSILVPLLLVCGFDCVAARAGTIVIANRSPVRIAFQFREGENPPQDITLTSGELCSLSCKQPGKLAYANGDGAHEVPLDLNSVYGFIDTKGEVVLRGVALTSPASEKAAAQARVAKELSAANAVHPAGAGNPAAGNPSAVIPATNPAAPLPAATLPAAALPAGVVPKGAPKGGDEENAKKYLVIPIKVLVDDDETGSSHAWKGRIARRVQAANEIFEKQCRVKFEIVAYDTWVSDNRITDFNQSLAEFERKVKPEPARIAVGFTSQYALPMGHFHLGGTRGPMHPHVLVREWSQQINEPERLEVLIHELGHYMGAVHSPASDSSMRAILGDRQARAKDFRIGFDPINVLAMSMISEAMRVRDVHSLAELPMATQLRLNDIYTSIGAALPNDPTPDQYRQFLRYPQYIPSKKP